MTEEGEFLGGATHRIRSARKVVREALETTGMRGFAGNRKRVDFREDPSCTIKRWYSRWNPSAAFFRSHVVRLAFTNFSKHSHVSYYNEYEIKAI